MKPAPAGRWNLASYVANIAEMGIRPMPTSVTTTMHDYFIYSENKGSLRDAPDMGIETY